MVRPKPRYGPCQDCGVLEGEQCRDARTVDRPMKTVHKGRPKIPKLTASQRVDNLMARMAKLER